jgi:hypothetical protein
MFEGICLHASKMRKVDTKIALILRQDIGFNVQSDKVEINPC